MLSNILLVFHVLIAIGVIGLILLQQGKGADAGAAFGSGASGTVFGSAGSGNFLSRTTGILAALFFATSLGLAYLANDSAKKPTSVVDQVQTQTAPATTLPAENDKPATADTVTTEVKPGAEKPVAEQPATEKPAAEKPAAEQKPAPTLPVNE